jgi:peptidoglycan/xylan/chitin deacetylase (PgdA/CDA1 family)
LPLRLAEWRALAALGHELGNHSLFHHCSARGPGRSWVQPAQDLDRLDAQQVQAQVLAANTWLQALDGRRERSFTPPCLDIRTGGVDYAQALQPAFVAYRARPGALNADPATLDPYAVGADAVENLSGAQLIALAEAAARQGGLLNLTFHGVGAEYLQVSREAHEALLAHLAQHRDRFWTDSFVNVMTHVRQQQAARRAAVGAGGAGSAPGPAR